MHLLLSTYCVPGTVLNVGYTEMNKTALMVMKPIF